MNAWNIQNVYYIVKVLFYCTYYNFLERLRVDDSHIDRINLAMIDTNEK